MRYFALLDVQHMALALGFGMLAVLLVYVGWRGYPPPDPDLPADADPLAPAHEGPARPLPPILIVVYVLVALWAIGYAMVEGIYGGAIG